MFNAFELHVVPCKNAEGCFGQICSCWKDKSHTVWYYKNIGVNGGSSDSMKYTASSRKVGLEAILLVPFSPSRKASQPLVISYLSSAAT